MKRIFVKEKKIAKKEIEELRRFPNKKNTATQKFLMSFT